MRKYTVTPWRTQSDLLEVRQQLYGPVEADTDSRRHAVERVMAWKMRGNLPHAVESTALLVDAVLHHDTKINSIFSIRAVYSAAFCHFVTGFCDIGRHKQRSLEPSSMLDIAKQIDMPAEFVALRHEATHGELPSIQRLMTATRQALDWLWKVYWSRLDEAGGTDITDGALLALKSEVATILRGFRKWRREALRIHGKITPEQADEIVRTRDVLKELCKDSQAKTKALAQVLVEERLLYPANRELGSPLEGAYMIWGDLLSRISWLLPGFDRALGASVLERLTVPGLIDPQYDAEKEALSKWAVYMLDIGDRRTMFRDVMKWCCLYPGYWTHQIGIELLEQNERLEGDLVVEWTPLFHASSIEGVASGAAVHALFETEPMSKVDLESQLPDIDASHQPDYHLGGWNRAVLSASVPIGVVQ